MMAAVISNSPSFCRRRSTSTVSADVVCCWLKTISTLGHVVHFTLSRNYSEILGCRQHLLAESMKVPCPGSNRQIRFNQHFQRSNVASLLDYDHLCGFQYLNTNSHVRNLSFLTLNQRFEPILDSSPFILKSSLVTAVRVSDSRILSSVNI